MVRKRKIKEYENMSFVFNQFNDLVEKVEKDAYNMFYGENYRKHNCNSPTWFMTRWDFLTHEKTPC